MSNRSKINYPPYGSTDLTKIGKFVMSRTEYNNIILFSKEDGYEIFASTIINTINAKYYQIIMPYIEGIRLCDLLDTNIDEELYNKLLIEFNKLRDFIHTLNSKSLFHNDISTTNIIYTTDGCFKLIDFEFSNTSEIICGILFKNKDLNSLGHVLKEINDAYSIKY